MAVLRRTPRTSAGFYQNFENHKVFVIEEKRKGIWCVRFLDISTDITFLVGPGNVTRKDKINILTTINNWEFVYEQIDDDSVESEVTRLALCQRVYKLLKEK